VSLVFGVSPGTVDFDGIGTGGGREGVGSFGTFTTERGGGGGGVTGGVACLGCGGGGETGGVATLGRGGGDGVGDTGIGKSNQSSSSSRGGVAGIGTGFATGLLMCDLFFLLPVPRSRCTVTVTFPTSWE
jgi:hypothetical protein